MKKIIAGIIALTAVICTFTGCGKETADEVEEVTTAEITTGDEEETTAADTTEDISDPDGKEVSYEDAIYEFIDAYNALDYQKTFEMQMPDGFMKAIDFTLKHDENEKRNADEIIRDFQRNIYGSADDEHIKIRIKNIVDKEQMQEKDLLDLKLSFGMYAWMIKLVDENGSDPEFDDSMIEESLSDLDTNDFLEQSNISEAYRVKMELENEKTGNTYDGYIYVLNCKGKWKINAREILSSDRIIAQKMLKNAPRSIYNAQNTAIVEMDEEMGDIISWKTCFIVCSDESKDYNVPESFDRDYFIEKTRRYFEAIDSTVWFSVICNGVAYVTAFVKDDPENIGYFPDFKNANEEIISVMGEKLSDDMSFDERYDICVDVISKK